MGQEQSQQIRDAEDAARLAMLKELADDALEDISEVLWYVDKFTTQSKDESLSSHARAVAEGLKELAESRHCFHLGLSYWLTTKRWKEERKISEAQASRKAG